MNKKTLKEQVYLMKYELGVAGSKTLRNKSAKYNEKSLYKEGEIVECIFVTGGKAKIHLILGKSKRRNAPMNYLIELPKGASGWALSEKEKVQYGCHPDKQYKIVLEQWLVKEE